MNNFRRSIAWLSCVVCVVGCAITAPSPVAVDYAIQPGEQLVGGTIMHVAPKADHTRVTLRLFPITKSGVPLLDQPAMGEIELAIAGFLDPEIYQADQPVSAVGSIVRPSAANVIALMQVREHNLWPEFVRAHQAQVSEQPKK